MWVGMHHSPIRRRFLWAIATGVVLTAALVAAFVLKPLPATTEVRGQDHDHDACIDTAYDDLGGIDVGGPISIQTDRFRPQSEDESDYLNDVKKLVEAHNKTAHGTRYVLSISPGFAILCERDDPKKCRVRHLRLFRTIHPSLAAQILFANTVRAYAQLQDCRFGARYL